MNLLLQDLHGRSGVVELAKVAAISVEVEDVSFELGVLVQDCRGARSDTNAGSLVVAANIIEIHAAVIELPDMSLELRVLVATEKKRRSSVKAADLLRRRYLQPNFSYSWARHKCSDEGEGLCACVLLSSERPLPLYHAFQK